MIPSSDNTPMLQVNNAGCMVNTREITEDGLESNFATNTLGNLRFFFYTYYLVELCLSTTKINQAQPAVGEVKFLKKLYIYFFYFNFSLLFFLLLFYGVFLFAL